MKYQIHVLDGRHSYHQKFDYYVGFAASMNQDQGPLQFAQVQKWCMDTWGWSAEVKQWRDILSWFSTQSRIMGKQFTTREEWQNYLPDCCNPHWSWSNGYDDLRIYLRSSKELAFFKLANPIDQK